MRSIVQHVKRRPSSVLSKALPSAAAALLAFGCGGNGGSTYAELPGFFKLNAIAHAEADDETVDCKLDFIVELAGEVSRTDAVVEYVGTMGGEAERSILKPDQSGAGFIADAYSEIQALLILPDHVEINTINVPPGDPNVTSRFWDEIQHFDGRLGPADRITGEWICAPLDVEYGGVQDDSIFAPGTWHTDSTAT
jgi:hypothetical protein